MSKKFSPFQFLFFSLVFITACLSQDNKNLPEENPYQQQFDNLIGKWEAVHSHRKGIDTLSLFENGQFLLKQKFNQINGKWKIEGVQKMSLSDEEYRFYFNRKNLILEDKAGNVHELTNPKSWVPDTHNDGKLSEFIRRIYQDRNGNYWLGTNGDGVIRYDGKNLKYFSVHNGFGGVAVRGIVEDAYGNVWFGTERGISKYNARPQDEAGKTFTNFTELDGLINNDVWCITIDSKGIIWIGTLQGISRFDGKEFTPFELPAAEPDSLRGVTSARIVHSIMEDSKGRMWFGNNGGAYIYDPTSGELSNISEEDGLCHNAVNCILEDKDGNIWFATHHNGVCQWDGNSFTHFTEGDGVNGSEAWNLYEDKAGNIWFPMENYGVYRFEPSSGRFTNFHEKEGLVSGAIQCTFEDQEGRLWLGGYKGLFRYDILSDGRPGKPIFPVTRKGPWQ